MNNILNLKKLISEVDSGIDSNFTIILNASKDILQLNNTNFARRFATTNERVNDWLNGDNLPHADIRKIVFDWLVEQINKGIK